MHGVFHLFSLQRVVAKGEEDGQMIPAFVEVFLHCCKDNQWGEEHQVRHLWHSCMIWGGGKERARSLHKTFAFKFFRLRADQVTN